MKKTSTIKKISLSTVLITMLAGCGAGGGASSSTSSTTANSSSRSLSYDACVDLNQNASCEEAEKALNPADYTNIAVVSKDANAKYLLAPAGASKVSAWSTLVYNEMKYNPLVENNEAKAQEYLKQKLSLSSSRALDESVLSDQLSKNLEDSIKKAVDLYTNYNKNSVIAAVCDKFLEQKAEVTVSVSDINKQHRVINEIQTTKLHEASWENKVYNDLVGQIRDDVEQSVVNAQGGERIVSINGNGNYLVSASQYHNALTIVDYNDGSSKEIMYNKFAAFRPDYTTGVGGTLDVTTTSIATGGSSSAGGAASSGGSARSLPVLNKAVSYAVSDSSDEYYNVNKDPENKKGLWEHLLEDAKITKDGKTVYALIRSKNESTTYSNEETLGFYKINVGKYGVYPYNANSTVRINSKDILKFEVSNDGEAIVVYGQVVNDKDEKKNLLRLYNKNLSFQKAVELDNVQNFKISSDNKYLIAQIKSDYLNKPKLIKYSLPNLEKVNEIEVNFDANKLYTYALGTMAVLTSGSKFEIVNLETMKKEFEKSIDISATHSSLSTNGNYLALASKEKIEVYALNTPSILKVSSIDVDISNIKDVKKYPDEENSINNLSFIGDSLLSYTQKQNQNKVVTYEIKDTNKIMSMDNKLEMALASLTKDNVNNGYDFNKVSKKLNLISSYEDIDFIWTTSNLQSNIDFNTGNITRDKNSDISGKLKVTAQGTFRNVKYTKEKTFDITVLKDVNKVSDSIEKLSITDTKNTAGLTRKIIANSDASTVISYTELDDSFRGYNLFNIQSDKLVFTDGNENSTNRLYRDQLLNMTFKTDEKVLVVTVNRHYPSFSSIYLQDVQSDNTLQENFNQTNLNKAHIGNKGTPLSAGFSSNKEKIVVIRKHHDFENADFYADIYRVSGSKIETDKTIRLQPGFDYINTNAPAVNTDASAFYQISKNTIHKQDENTHKSIRLDGVNAVYFFDGRVYASTSTGLIVSYNENLEEASKQEFNLGVEASINSLSFANGSNGKVVYAFANGDNAGAYLLKVNASNEMSEFKFIAKANKGGAVSSNSENIFIYENPKYQYSASTKSNISYSKAQ